MAAPSILQVMKAIEARLRTIPDLNVAVTWPGQLNTPQAVVGLPESLNYHQTMKQGFVQVNFPVGVFTSTASDTSGQKELLPYLDLTGDKSILQAIEADKTLGGVVDDCIVVGMELTGSEQFGVIGYYGATLTLRITARGNNS